MTQPFKVQLLHGLQEGDRRHTVVTLRDPNGHDEAMLAELRREAVPAECVSALLAALTLCIGEIEHPTIDRIRELTAGDRERLLLALCTRILGAEADLIAACPSCSALAEMPVRFANVAPVSSQADPRGSRVTIDAADGQWTATLLPPTGNTLEKAARGGSHAARDLIVDCIEELTDPSGSTVAPRELPIACEAAIADALFALDPVAESLVQIDCPSCGQPIRALVDGFAILQSAFGNPNRLYDDVFRMSRSYHWSEAEFCRCRCAGAGITSPSQKRRRRTHERFRRSTGCPQRRRARSRHYCACSASRFALGAYRRHRDRSDIGSSRPHDACRDLARHRSKFYGRSSCIRKPKVTQRNANDVQAIAARWCASAILSRRARRPGRANRSNWHAGG